MSCGLKKQQQNNEGGVHLTERTCSPYNPIIKQIVDDCLGLPIYPVSSIDAVIDEDGNTLRKLLDELVELIKSGNYEISGDITNKITEIQEYITNNYVSSDDFDRLFNTLQKLVYAISAVETINSVELESKIFALDNNNRPTDEPYIVWFIKNLNQQLLEITGGGNSENGLSLREIIDILLAVANFNDSQHNPSNHSQLVDDHGHISIILQILELQKQVGKLTGNDSDDGDDLTIPEITDLLLAVAGFKTTYQSGISDIQNRNEAVKIILEILNLKEYVGLDPDNPTPTPDPNPESDSLLGRVQAIEALLKAVASYDDTDNAGVNLSTTLLPLFTSDDNRNKLIEIVYQIKNALARLDAIDGGGNQGENTITHRVEILEEESKTHAHLDSTLQELNVNKLAVDEYPVTSAYFLSDHFGLSDLVTDVLNRPNYTKPVYVYFPKGTAIAAEVNANIIDKYDYNGNGWIDIGDITILIAFILGRIPGPPAGKTFYVNEDSEVNISDVNALIQYILDENLYITQKTIKDEWSKYIFELRRIDQNDIQVPPRTSTSYDIEIEDLFYGWQVIKHPLIDGKIYTDIADNTPYRYDEKREDYGLMYNLTDLSKKIVVDSLDAFRYLTGERILSSDQGNSPVLYRILLSIDDNRCYYCSGNKIGNNYVKDDRETPFEEGELFIVEDKYNVIVPPSNWEFWEEINSLTYSENSSSPNYVSIKDSDNNSRYYKFKTGKRVQDIGQYTIADVTILIDSLLSATLPKFMGHVQLTLSGVISYEEQRLASETLTDGQKTILQQIINSIKNPSSLSVTASHEDTKIQEYFDKYIYYVGNDGKIRFLLVDSKYYNTIGRTAMCDLNGDNVFNISDITAIIDLLLSGDNSPVVNEGITLGASLYRQTSAGLSQLTPSNADSAYGRLFIAEHSDLEYHITDNWYYFDALSYLRPLVPTFTLNYETTLGDLYLFGDAIELSVVNVGGASKSFNQSSSLTNNQSFIDLGPNSTPYLFGSGPFDYSVVGDASTNTDMCFLDEDGNFVASAGETLFTLNGIDLYTLYNDTFLTYYISLDQGLLDALDISPELLMSSNNDCTEISIGRGLVDYSLIARSKSAPYKFDLAEKVKYLIAEGLDKMQNEKSEDDVLATLKSCFNTPNEGIVTLYHCLNCHHSVLNGVAFIDKCYLYEVKEKIHIEVNEEYVQRMLDLNNFSMTHFPEFVSVDASITLLRTNNVQEGVTYYFPKFGLQLKFKNEVLQVDGGTLNTITPVVVYVESELNQLKYLSKCMLDRLFRSLYIIDPVEPTGAIVDVKPNEYLNLGLVDYCIFDFSKFTEIPGNEVINVSGRFRAGVDSMPIELIPSSIPFNTGGEDSPRGQLRSASIEMTTFNPIQFAKTCPSISHGHIYEYHMLDGIFSFVDVTPTSTAQVIDEGGLGSTQK